MPQAYDVFLGREAPSGAATSSLAGRELPADIVQSVSNLTMGQLFYILGHIQKLSAQAPVTAQALLAENPQICYALLHAECLAGMIEEPLLPMTAEELKRAKAMARRMRDDLDNHEIPPSAEQVAAHRQATAMTGGISKYGRPAMPPGGVAPGGPPPSCGRQQPQMVPPAAGMQAGMPPPQFCKAPGAPPPPPPPPVQVFPPQQPPMMAAASSGFAGPCPADMSGGFGGEAQKAQLMQKLVQLSPDQIAQLPEQTKVQLLNFLQQNAG